MTFDQALLTGRMPPVLLQDVNCEAAGAAIDPELRALFGLRGIPALYFRLGELSSAQLDHLAAQFDIDAWSDAWDIGRKRAVFAASYAGKRRMGTLAAVKSVITAFGAAVRIEEWWETEPKGTPHTFTVYVSFSSAETLPSAVLQEQALALINMAKPARSLFQMIVVNALDGEAAAFTGVQGRLATADANNI